MPPQIPVLRLSYGFIHDIGLTIVTKVASETVHHMSVSNVETMDLLRRGLPERVTPPLS